MPLLKKQITDFFRPGFFLLKGGEVAVEKDLSSVSLGPNPMPHLAHVIIGLESPCHQVNF